MLALVLFAVLTGGGCRAGEDPRSGGSGHDAVSPPRADIRQTLIEFADAVHRQELDAIVQFFSDDFTSREATGKEAVRDWWTRVIETDLVAALALDLETANLRVGTDTAEVIYYDQRGELACTQSDTPCDTPQPYLAFSLTRHPEQGWLITGVPTGEPTLGP